jgi:hypothetical protein
MTAMSASSTTVSAALQAYVAEHARAEDPFVRELKAAAEARGLPAIWISPEQSSLMAVLLRARCWGGRRSMSFASVRRAGSTPIRPLLRLELASMSWWKSPWPCRWPRPI